MPGKSQKHHSPSLTFQNQRRSYQHLRWSRLLRD